MPEYTYIVYVNPLPRTIRQLPAELEALQSLCWEQSAIVRWRIADAAGVAESLGGNVLLVLVNCGADGAGVKMACQAVREACRSPILLIDPGGLKREVLEDFKTVAEQAVFIKTDELSDPNTILDKLRLLGVILPEPRVALDYEESDLGIRELVQWVGQRRLANDIQKFFPDARDVQMQSVAGGWSGAKICRVLVQGQEHFLKFFEDSSNCMREHQRHREATKWLRRAQADVPIRLVPGIGDDADSQLRAFPQRRPVAYPVCYISASSVDHRRETLKALYHTKDEVFVEKAFRRLIKVLRTGQPVRSKPAPETPWHFGASRSCFALSQKIKVKIIETLDDLQVYGPPMCEKDAQEWNKRRQVVELLIYRLPTWLSKPLMVRRGHSHGDPNPRNCLLPSDNPNDLRLIDCGDYEMSGRMVSDLGLIERDIKLVLMGTEEAADEFLDLDTRWLSQWCNNERNSIARGIGFEPGDALPPPAGEFPSATRAYRLVGQVRQRARVLCGRSDAKGLHYFAALLYWTLDSLRYEAIRPTKKLLALYSASEILLRFEYIS